MLKDNKKKRFRTIVIDNPYLAGNHSEMLIKPSFTDLFSSTKEFYPSLS